MSVDDLGLTWKNPLEFLALFKFHLGIAKGNQDWNPWIGFNDQENESIFVWPDGSTGEIYT